MGNLTQLEAAEGIQSHQSKCLGIFNFHEYFLLKEDYFFSSSSHLHSVEVIYFPPEESLFSHYLLANICLKSISTVRQDLANI